MRKVLVAILFLVGTAMGRAGQVFISTDNTGQVWVGGDAVTCVAGTVEL